MFSLLRAFYAIIAWLCSALCTERSEGKTGRSTATTPTPSVSEQEALGAEGVGLKVSHRRRRRTGGQEEVTSAGVFFSYSTGFLDICDSDRRQKHDISAGIFLHQISL